MQFMFASHPTFNDARKNRLNVSPYHSNLQILGQGKQVHRGGKHNHQNVNENVMALIKFKVVVGCSRTVFLFMFISFSCFCSHIIGAVHSSHHYFVRSPTKSPISNHQFFCFKSPKRTVQFSCDKYFKFAIAT